MSKGPDRVISIWKTFFFRPIICNSSPYSNNNNDLITSVNEIENRVISYLRKLNILII